MIQKKKNYVTPEMKVYEIGPTVLLSGSGGSLYDRIETSDEVKDNPG